ncbi:MAG: hypothetical protein AAB560_00395 [Patescibacteria group bacterium]
MKNFPTLPLFLLITLVFLNGAFIVIGIYQQSVHHQDWCQNWCLQIKPLWADVAQAVASFNISAATFFFILAAAIFILVLAKTLAALFSPRRKSPPRFPAGNFFSPLFLALRRRSVQPLLFD